jgi:hypothetical protein
VAFLTAPALVAKVVLERVPISRVMVPSFGCHTAAPVST